MIYAKVEQIDRSTGYWISGDYEEATDHVCWERAKLITKQYLKTLCLDTEYNIDCIDALLSSREFVQVVNKKGDVVEESFTTLRGALMGEPGTKIILTILTKVAETLSR
jgi:hypothetical protein